MNSKTTSEQKFETFQKESFCLKIQISRKDVRNTCKQMDTMLNSSYNTGEYSLHHRNKYNYLHVFSTVLIKIYENLILGFDACR
ncbi:hypothetical protein C0J52_03091 [Blattella germanica]|nr:hypothetical protein C0J52_03091 [Blattella germanica]